MRCLLQLPLGRTCSRPSTPLFRALAQKDVDPGTNPGRGSPLLFLLYAFDDAQVAIGTLAEHLQRFLVARAVMRRGRLVDAVELDDDDPLQQPRLIRFDGSAARQKPRSEERRVGKSVDLG